MEPNKGYYKNKNKHFNDLKFLLIITTFSLLLTFTVSGNNGPLIEVVLGANQKHHHNENKNILTMDKTESSQSEENQVHTKP